MAEAVVGGAAAAVGAVAGDVVVVAVGASVALACCGHGPCHPSQGTMAAASRYASGSEGALRPASRWVMGTVEPCGMSNTANARSRGVMRIAPCRALS